MPLLLAVGGGGECMRAIIPVFRMERRGEAMGISTGVARVARKGDGVGVVGIIGISEPV